MRLLALLLVVSACEDEPGAVPMVSELHGPIAEATPEQKNRNKAPAWRPSLSGAESRPAPVEPEKAPAAAPSPPRDLSDELKRAVGDPTSCLSEEMRGAAGPSILINVEAYIIDTGAVTRASAMGTGLDAASRVCIERRVENARIVAPPHDASHALRFSFELRRAP